MAGTVGNLESLGRNAFRHEKIGLEFDDTGTGK